MRVSVEKKLYDRLTRHRGGKYSCRLCDTSPRPRICRQRVQPCTISELLARCSSKSGWQCTYRFVINPGPLRAAPLRIKVAVVLWGLATSLALWVIIVMALRLELTAELREHGAKVGYHSRLRLSLGECRLHLFHDIHDRIEVNRLGTSGWDLWNHRYLRLELLLLTEHIDCLLDTGYRARLGCWGRSCLRLSRHILNDVE